MIDRLKRLLAGVDERLRRYRWGRVLRQAVIGFVKHEALQFAGSMAYFSILSVFQLLVLGVVVLSYFVGEGEARQFVIDQVRAGSPLDADTIGGVIDAVIASRTGISLFGLIFLIWGALGIFSAISQGVGRAFGVETPRPFVQDKLIGLLLMVITGLLGVASVAIGIVTGIVQAAAGDALAQVPGGYLGLSLIGFVTPLLLTFSSFLVLYRLVPNRPVTIGEALPGAVVATLLWTLLRIGFTWYATNVANYDSAFGPISAAISLLVFLYFASVIVLLGAEVSRANVLEDEEQRRLADEARAAAAAAAAPPSPQAPEPDPASATPGWAMAIGGVLTAAILRIFRRQRR